MISKVVRFGIAATLSTLALAFVFAVSPVAADSAATASAPATAAATQLTPEEAAGLAYMREEEKLARDVYQYLYQAWQLPVFSNIAASEQIHMDAIKTLLDRYQLADPAAGKGVGEFTDSFQDLYNELIAQGSQSSAEALKVGVAIETLDINDLQEQLAQTAKLDITTVYQNLLKGSQNHLLAFTANQGRGGGRGR